MKLTSGAAIVVLCTFLVGSIQAQEARSGGGASAAMLQQLQQLASERTDLQSQNAKLQKDLEDMRRQRDALKTGQATVDHRAQQSEAAIHQLQEQAAARQKAADENVARWKSQLDQLVAKYRELAQTLSDTENERGALQRKVAAQDHSLSTCTDDNASLYNLNTEVLDHFQHQSSVKGLLRAEPFTQIARTRLDNAALEYKERAQELKVQAAPAKGAGKSGT
jgi:chromosome segregation ATPase